MKISFITTVFNEEGTIVSFLKSILSQTVPPTEVIIVDGGSTDRTVEFVNSFKKLFQEKSIGLYLYSKRGNRSVGRNFAIKKSHYEIITCSDAGNTLDKDWIKNITEPFKDKKVDVVAGFYRGKGASDFQKSLVPYVLVMKDKVDPDNFLPATRSVAFKKTVWQKAGRFDERLSHNEDYAFAKKLKENGANIVVSKKAIVNWSPRNNIKEAFVMFFRFALGDVEAGIIRGKVLLLFGRYFLAGYLLLLNILYKSFIGMVALILLVTLYIIWSIYKNYKYVKRPKALLYLPLIQFAADAAVMFGTTVGLTKSISRLNMSWWISSNRVLILLLVLYFLVGVVLLRWGAPNFFHPFPYHMDEWHQLQSVRAAIAYGTINVEGAANGVLFHFLTSAFYLAPFTLIDYINPVEIGIMDHINRQNLFDLLRINTLLYGLGSILLMHRLLKSVRAVTLVPITLLVISPIWVSLSGYFKYDIALFFWLTLSLFFFVRFSKEPTKKNFLIASVVSGLTASVKVSAIPIIAVVVVGYLIFSKRKSFKEFLLGMVTFVLTFILFGMPDVLFWRGNTIQLFIENLVIGPEMSNNYQLGQNWLFYSYLTQLPLILGYGTLLLFMILLAWWTVGIVRRDITENNKLAIFLLVSLLIFFISLVPLRMSAIGNRMLVLLPFIVVLIGLWYANAKRVRFVTLMVLLLIGVQSFQTLAWIAPKTQPSPQEVSSKWIQSEIEEGSSIGIENIPIYQLLPDIAQREFYYKLYNPEYKSKYEFRVIDAKTVELPEYIIITNGEMEKNIFIDSPKKSLVSRIERLGYERKSFYTDLSLLSLFGDREDFYIANIVTLPVDISIYKKAK